VLRGEVEDRLRDEHGSDGALFPAYADYCIGNVPDTIRSVLGAPASRPLPDDVLEATHRDVDRVVMVVVDGYGLDAWRRDHEDVEFLRRLTERGRITPLTSIYPSETAAAISTLETGQLPCEHGRIGWNVYEPTTDRSFLALDGRVKVGDGERAEEAFEGVQPLYPSLVEAGADCHRLQPFEVETPGVTQHGYDGLDGFGDWLAALTEAAEAPAYLYGYLPHVDHVAHEVGTEAAAYLDTVAAVTDQLAVFVDELDPRTAERTLLLVLADHGHVNTDPERNVDVSANETVMANLRRHADGTPVRLAGSPRNVHLHLRDGTVEATREALADLDAHVFTRREALDRGLFGDRPPTDRFRRRCGDLVLTHRAHGTWFADVEADELGLVGMHGGLHPDEMLVPFAAARASRLASA
jgi:hypothetical protein